MNVLNWAFFSNAPFSLLTGSFRGKILIWCRQFEGMDTDKFTWYFGILAVLVIFLNWTYLIFPLQKVLGAWWMITGVVVTWGIVWGLFFLWDYLGLFGPSEDEEPTAEIRKPESRPSRKDLLLRYLLAHPHTIEGAVLQMALKDLGHETEFSKEHPVCSRANFPAKHLQSI